MRKLVMALAAAGMVAPTAVVLPTEGAIAQSYKGKTWRGRDGRTYCRRKDGTTGLLIGGAAGALAGNAVGGTTSTIIGAAAGALLGREVDKSRGFRCR